MNGKVFDLYTTLKSAGADVGSEQEFNDYFFAKGDQGYKNRYNTWKTFKDAGADVGENYEQFRDWLGLQPANPATAPSTTEQVVSDVQKTLGENQRVINRIGNRQQRAGLNVGAKVQLGGPGYQLGQNSKVTPGQQRFDLGTGKIQQTYITPQGNEYGSREMADLEQNTIDIAERSKTLPGQLEDAYAERKRLQAEIDEETARNGYGNSTLSSYAPQVPGSIQRQSAERLSNEKLQTLYAAQLQNEERITALEAERDDAGFWQGFIDAAKNPTTFTFGLTDALTASSLSKIKNKIDAAKEKGLEPKLTPEEQALLENTFNKNMVDQQYGENRGFMYRAGGISMQALPFVAEFLATGGFSALTEAGASAGTKLAERLALEGFKKSLLKNTGVVAGDIASGLIMANTTGVMRTYADVKQRHTGDVTIDNQGNYDFEGGKSAVRSLYEAEVANTLEYYTEKLGEHLQLGKWIAKGAEKMGLSKLSKAVNYLSSSSWLERGGIQDYPSEVVEEQANLLLNAMLVGDNNFSVDPDSKDFKKSVFNPKTQGDIWGGMLFSIGLMQAPRLASTGYNAAGYYAFKKNVDMSSDNASVVFGADNWAMIKEQIDNCDNDKMGELIGSIADGSMNDAQKHAAMFYAGNLLKMRGYNMGMMAGAKDLEKQSTPEAAISQTLNQSYVQGHQATNPDERKQYFDESEEAASNLSQYGEEFAKMVTESENPAETLDYLLNLRDDFYTDEQITAAADYYQKQARMNGMLEGIDDEIDRQVEQYNAVVRSHTHQGTGMVVMAKYDDQDYYVIGGEIGIDGAGQPALDGTGGAVIVEDAVTGEKSVKPANDLQIVNTQNAADLIQQNETALRQQLEQQADDDITYGSPAQEVYQQEDAVTLNDGAGGTVDGVIGMVPNAVDGVYVVYTSDGRALQLTADDLNRRIVTHNGVQVKSAPAQNQPQNAQVPVENAQVQQQNTQGAEAAGKAGQEQTGGDEPAASALSRIPVRMDENGQPMKNKKGRPILDWHKVSVEDAADALTETTGGDKLMARDTASSLVKDAQEKLEKIRKQKPKGEDPIEMAESRVAIRRAEEEQQAIIKQWQNVAQEIKRRMDAEAAERQAEIEAAKSEEQRQREAEEARQRKEQQDEQDRQRLREQIEKDKKARSKEYEPLVKARKEMAGDADAMDVLNDTEPRSLEEWVSSLLSPHSFLWLDASESERGLQTELGLKRADMQRFMTLFGTKENDAKPFGKAVLDIYEALPESMKNMYTDEDVARVVRDMFQSMENSAQMMHLTELNRIEQARQVMQENERREEEAEMEAWAEAYHLTPEERETFEDFLQQQASETEQEIINNIIADESYRTSTAMDQQPVSGTAAAGTEGSEGQVQQTAEATGTGTDEEAADQGAEAQTGQPPVADNNVPGRTQSVDREALRELFRQIGADEVLADRISDYDVEQLTAMVEDWEVHNDDYGYVMEQQKDALKSKDKKVRDEAQKKVDEAQQVANEAFVPIEEYIEGLNVKYGIEIEEPFEGAIPTPKIDKPRYDANRQALVDAYKSGDPAAITAAAQAIQQFVDEGLDAGEDKTGMFDIAEDYDGNDPEKLADQYIIRTFWDRYVDDDADQEYIKTGLKPSMRNDNKFVDKEEDTIAATVKAARNGDKNAQTKLDKFGIKWEKKPVVRFVAQGEVESILNGNRYEGRFGNGRVDVTNNTEVTTAATADYRITFKDELDWTLNDRLRMKNEELGDGYIMDGYSLDDVATIEKRNPDGTYTKVYDAANPVAPSEQLKPTEPPSGQQPIGKTSTAEEIAAQEAQVDTTPTEAQKEAGNYQKGHIMVDGYDITIENPKGSIRRGTDASGKQWEQEMHNTYGYIKGTEGVDGDHIDVFLSDNPASGKVWVVDQVNKDGSFDEHKVMYGFANVADATKAYLSNYEEGWQGLGAISGISREEFKKWVESSHRKTKPFREYALAKSAEAKEKKASKPAKEHKRIVSDEKMEELRKQLLAKFNNMNEGIDVERMLLGAMYAVGKIERGVTKFTDYATQMVDEIGDAIRPYLKAFYEAVRNMPEAAPYRDQMTPADEVAAFDEYNFDKQRQPDVFTKAEQVVKKSKAKQQVKKIEKEVNQKLQQGDLFAGDLFGEPELAKEETKAQEPANHKEPKLRPATEADLESEHPIVYLNGHPYNIIAVMRSGEQISATQFSEPKVDSVMLTNGKSVKLEDLMVEDENAGKEKPKPKTPWWNDSSRPQSIDPSDYRTYMTDEARKYFASHPAFGDWKRKDIAFVTAAVWDGVVIPYEALKDLPEIVAAEQVVKDATANGVLQISEEERDQHAQRLLDAEHGSAIFENGKIKKVNGVEDFSGPVRQERKALVIIGYPAAGKSSVFANRLSNELGARIIDSDTVKPWLKGFDGGNGAGYVQEASSEVAERALDIAVGKGDNIILPRIGGSSVIALSAALKLAGYDVQLYFNDVATVTSVDRATSRFAETGRYLSLQYLTSKDGVPSNNFINFAEKKIGDYINELSEGKVQELRGRLRRLLESETVDGTRLWQSLAADQGGYRTLDEYVSVLLEPRGTGVASGPSDLIFSYSEWKSNDVAFGEKPKEIWNSKSGKPMPNKEVKDNGVQSEQRLPGKPSSSGEGEGQEGRGTGRVREGLGSESNRDQYVGPEHSVTNQPAQPKQAPKHNSKRNNSGERGKDYAPTSPKARFNANVEAIKMMRELIDQGIEAPTKDQMEVLRQYSGWGGLGTYFNDESSAENKILRDLLDEEEYNDAVMSVNSAYYTPATVIDTLWDVAKAMGFKGGNIVEGSAGIGNIIGQMPKDISRQSDIEAVEIDKISGNILKLLYPDAKVHIQGFQDTVIRNGSVDLAITNVPFVTGLHVIDKVDKDLSRRFTNIHDFCIAKNIRKLREGGLGIFITSSGTLDKSTDLRAWITDEGQADVVGAFRLNNETFGGTKVTSDIIVVRKRVNGVKSSAAIDVSKASPLRVGTYEDKYGDEHQTTMVVNDYFKEHPEMMAGEMAFGYEKGDTFRPGSYGLYPVDGKNQDKMMAKFVKSMGEKADVSVPQKQPQKVAEPNQLTAVKEGRMLIDDNGRICVSRYGEAVPLGLNDQKVKGQTKQQCFKDYQAVQAAVDDVLQQQLNDPNDEALKPKLAALNKAYDLFTKRYGTLHKNTAISFLRNDIDFPSFQALELYREEKDINGKVTVITAKPKLFSERVIGFKTEPQPKTVKDAVIASIFRTNGIDLDWIASKLNEVAAPPHGDKWTTEDVRKGILVSRLGFEDPSTGQLVIRYKYLSGNVREKLAIAEQYNTEGETAGRYAANIEELKKAVPMDIPAHLIDFSLGSSWIPVELYKDFVKETFNLYNVRIAHIEGSWAFDEGFSFRNEKNRSAGVYSEKFRETIYGHQLFASALNNRPYKVSKQVTEGWGSSKTTHTEVDQAATQACNVRIDEIKAEFREWTKKKMQDDPELARRIEKIYNDKFNALVPMEVGEEFLPERFEGANTGITLRPHQKLGAIKGLISPTMLAHEVGTGKSFTLITTAMEMRRLGTAKKPMIVVQNATVAQLTADAKLLYPNAKVLSLSEQDRDAEGRRAFYAKIKYNDWDIIIVPQSTFERIPDSPERELQFIQEKIDEKKHVIEAAQAAGVDARDLDKLKRELEKIEQEYGDKSLDSDPANASNAPKRKKKDAKREAASLDKAETRAKEQLDRAVDDVQFFDDLGVDALLVDEAHEYKHLGFQTSMGRGIKGIDPSYSKKCAGLYNKTRSVYEKAGWKNVVFATGTPISNTAAEIWTFMKYLMPADVMRANDIYYFDDFVHNFGNVSQMLEFTTSGKFKENTRFAAYVNKPELIRIWSQVADTVRSADTEVKDKEPEEEGGKDQDVFLPQSPSLIRIMAAVRAELERFENMTGQQKKENSSIPLTMYGIAKRAAIDPRLVDAEAPDEPLSKTNAAVKEILKDLKATQSYKGTVAVFCDNQNRLGTNSTGKKVVDFNIYDDMKEKLIKAGVPEKQIAIVKSGMSITAKQKIFDAVNSGDIRVVLGSTQTLGTGVNMQERLHLLIHMDAPDRPMDYTQRNGRIKRQGNLHKEWGKTIRIVRFGVEDSLDVTAYQRLKTKSGFIDSIMNGKAALADNQTDRTVEEEEEGLFDNPVAVLSGSQYALKKNQAERELRKYQGKKAQWEADQIYVVNQIRHNANELEAYKANIGKEQKQLERIKSMFPDGTVKTITVEGVKIDMTKDDGVKKLGEVIKEKINDPVNAIVKRNRENAIYNDETLEYTIALDGHNIKFTVKVVRESVWENGKMKTIIHKYTSYSWTELNMDSMDSSRSVRDYLDEIIDQVVTGQDSQDRIDAMQQAISRINAETEQIQKRVGQPFQFGKELEEAEKNVEEYTALMKKEMEEKEAKYAEQQKEAEADGKGFNLNKAEEESEDEDLYSADEDWDEPVFYSNAEMAVESILQEKATPEQWLAMIQKNGGIKAGEDKWLGLSDWLINNEKRTLTKQEVLGFIKANQIEVEDVNYGRDPLDVLNQEFFTLRKKYMDAGDGAYLAERKAMNDLENKYNGFGKATYLQRFDDGTVYVDYDYDYPEKIKSLEEQFGNNYKVIDDTRLQYTTKGLENKQEIALTVPTIEPYNVDEIHFGDAGGGRAVAWVRFGETTDADGKRVLVIDEVQSKRRQDAREKGYGPGPEEATRLSKKAADDYRAAKTEEEKADAKQRFDYYSEYSPYYAKGGSTKSGVPYAPFEKNWHELAMKRMFRYAAENSYDKVAWTTGIQQAERYKKGYIVEDLYYKKNDDGTYNISIQTKDRRGHGDGRYTDYGLQSFPNQTEGDVINLLGKETAQKLFEGKGRKGYSHNGESGWTTFKGNELRIGYEGMKGFYDQMLVRFMNKYGKKWGVQVGKTELPNVEAPAMWSVDVTPEMKASVMQGQPMFRGMEEFEDGQLFPINVTHAYSSFDVLGRTPTYSTDLMPDVYNSEVQMIDAIRRQYPTYYAHIEDGNVVMESWRHVMGAADGARQRKDQGSKSYVERKTSNAINAVNSLARQMGLDVEVLTTTEGLDGKKARAKGWFNPKTGKITLVLPNHANRSDLINTLLHEGVAHFGLRKMFGQSFNTFLDNVYNNVSPEIKKRIDAAVKRNGWSRHEATEEYLARLAERTDFEHATNQGWWQKIKDFFLQMLTKAGVVMDELTDNELRYILWRSYDNLLHPDRRRNIFDKAREVSMQYQLRVGQYSDRERQKIQRTGKTDTSWMAAEEELLNSTDYASDEINAIVDKAKADGTYMLAPNGKPSNLNELQWAQVRTKAFKEWFGDWENDPENASKVVDENGEPKVMYHKTNLDVVNKGVPFYTFYEDSHFGTKGQANDRVRSNDTGVKMYEVFLNIRNPQRRQDADEDYLEDKDMTMTEYWQLMAERSKSHGHDGIVYLNEYEDKEHPADSWIAFSPNQIKSATENSGDFSTEDNDIRYSIRTKEPPKKTGVGYKVFVLKDGQLYPPMVANPNGEGTPVGVWLDADAAPVAGTSKTGRPQVKAGGKGTQGGSGQLAYRPGWHLGTIPYALQFGRKDANGERTLFPNNFVWAEVEYADDVDYQDEARQEGINANGKYQHSLAGLKHVPTDGSYMYRTNPDPRTDPWVITGAMRVKKILTRDEVDELVRKAGREPQQIQDGDIVTDEAVKELNDEIKATMEADEMGLLYRDDDDAWVDDVAKESYERAVAQKGVKLKEAWQDSMVSLKLIQNAIARETGRVATGAEDAYNFENRMHGRAKNMTEQYDYQYYRPLLKAFHEFCKSKGYTQEKGIEYLIAKSGLERNVYYAFRTAAKEKLLQDIVAEREKLDKEYAAGRITEEDYKNRKAALARQETEGIDDAMDEVRNTLAWQRANEDYEEGRIGYTVLIDRMEALIRSHFKNYDKFAHDYSGLTEAFAKDMYDAAQDIKKEAQAAIDPKAKANLWKQYDNAMKEAYITARQYADDAVFSAEQDNKAAIDNLWSSVKKATEETLKHSYESGMISRKTYNRVRDMFNYYIPLRGWEENKAADVYTYMGKDNVFSPAVKKTWGRTSKADNPLAYIGNIAVSTIIAGHRNMMKQHFLNYVMNNPTSLVSISQSWYENISSDEDNPTWILRTADTAGKSADEVAQIVNDFNEEMQQKQRDGKAMPVTGRLRLDVHATKGQKAEHVVEVQRGGDTYQLYINGDPKAAQALNGTAAKAVSRISDTWLGRKITGINRSMAAFFTSKNPAFVVSNLSRDLNMAGASVAINEGPEYNARFIANVAKVLRPRMGESSKWMPASKQPTGLMPSLIRKWQKGTLNPSNETERLFKEFMDEGGETGFVNMLSIDSFKEKMQEEIREMNGSSFTGSKGAKEIAAHKGLRMLGDIFEFYNRCAEDATRFIVYMTSRQMGKTLEESVADAKNVTLNFNRKGTGDMGNAETRDLFIFVNPAIQALANMYRMAKGHPLKFGAVTAAFVAGGALIPIINQWFLNMFGGDDDKDAYWNLPPWVRKNNLVFWVPGTKNFVTIPLSQEFRVFYGVGEMASSLAMDHPVDKWGLELFSSVADLVPINPTGNGGNLMVDFAPTMVQPLMQIGENVDFTGRPIWRENQGNKYAPMYTKAYISTPRWMTWSSELLNTATGGNEGKKGVVEKYMPFWGDYINNPAVWNHLMQGYFGGMYNTIAKTFDVAATAASGEVPKIYQTPVINRFLNRPVERDNAGALGEDYYNLKEDAEAIKYEMKVWRKKAADGDEDAQKHVEEIESSSDWKQAEVIAHYEKIMKDLRAGEKAATNKEEKDDIKRSISLYRQQLAEELAALSDGRETADIVMQQFNAAKSLEEKKKLKLRMERLERGDKKVSDSRKDIDKALAYSQDIDASSDSKGTDRYLELATAENIRDDARIKAAKAKIKDNERYAGIKKSIASHERAIAENRKLLGKGNDKIIMKIIDTHRNAMLKSIARIQEDDN